ncbi:hypothetical protein [Paraburkholderia caballeronis]|uniref:hypothetical protein n=1 Tax=Paraburkholderia caballeronis TaxID=416943 RepID=UPI0014321A98|nr:hypothetical protein [Paraburkholderia caballeronis]
MQIAIHKKNDSARRSAAIPPCGIARLEIPTNQGFWRATPPQRAFLPAMRPPGRIGTVMFNYKLPERRRQALALRKRAMPGTYRASTHARGSSSAAGVPHYPTFTYVNSRVTLGGTYAPLIWTLGDSRFF